MDFFLCFPRRIQGAYNTPPPLWRLPHNFFQGNGKLRSEHFKSLDKKGKKEKKRNQTQFI